MPHEQAGGINKEENEATIASLEAELVEVNKKLGNAFILNKQGLRERAAQITEQIKILREQLNPLILDQKLPKDT